MNSIEMTTLSIRARVTNRFKLLSIRSEFLFTPVRVSFRPYDFVNFPMQYFKTLAAAIYSFPRQRCVNMLADKTRTCFRVFARFYYRAFLFLFVLTTVQCRKIINNNMVDDNRCDRAADVTPSSGSEVTILNERFGRCRWFVDDGDCNNFARQRDLRESRQRASIGNPKTRLNGM